MLRVTRDLVKEELCAMIDEVMDAKSAELCYIPFLDVIYLILCYCQVYGGPVEIKVVDTTIDRPQVV